MNSSTDSKQEGYRQLLTRQKFHVIKAGLQEYRLSEFIRQVEAKKGAGKGTILPFIRGLRFSALLIYAIREFLSGSGLTASWGHLMDENGVLCSPECDIIIHREGHMMRWNGDGGDKPVMDFKFIECENALVVISCKSYLVPSQIDIDYAIDLKKYCSNVWLFSECSQVGKLEIIKEKSEALGYSGCWTLYTWDRSNNDVVDCLEQWDNFVITLKALMPSKSA